MHAILIWVDQHPWVWPLVAANVLWPLVSALLNWVLWFSSSEKWTAFREKHPTVGLVLRVARAMGVDPRKTVEAMRDYVDAKRKGGGDGSPPAPTAGPTRGGLVGMCLAGVATLSLLGALAAGVAGCLVKDGQVRPDWGAIEKGVNIACLMQNAFLPNEEALMRLCDVAPDALPLARRIVGEHKAGVRAAFAKAGASRAFRDAYGEPGDAGR